ncbi:hypothetical protein BOTBODRAFT_136564 [Botryobasidium botryosum FD-172 SS1]|uniref:L-2-hydroxyglutarate dehydrogenase, mitochondrial n=1 Tax=Botryobasidium botryosum (strain FD-172 SS1) TaxID=930990 RepID=A0A067MFP9_BOTB1|nr:hypothetical protein BOTBODRAFT_136564 [Botryobasidium botryosum FD-172 SS1]
MRPSQAIRPLLSALNAAGKYSFKPPSFSVDNLIVGGGVVGLAIARKLVIQRPNDTTILVERHSTAGQETSSRNSEVVHAGIYYPSRTLKSILCIRGRRLLYDYCHKNHIPYQKIGKLIVALPNQVAEIKALHDHASSLHLPESQEPAVPIQLLTGDEARAMEPALSPDIAAALWSPETGIVDSHALMESFERDIGETSLSYSTKVVRIDRINEPRGKPGWVVQFVATDTSSGGEPQAVYTRSLINAAGLGAPFLTNEILPEHQWIPSYFARGSYVTCHGGRKLGVKRLLYPMPVKGMAGLGTHLTMDLAGNIKFGPDVEWITLGTKGEQGDNEPWKTWLTPSEERLNDMHTAIQTYLPGVSPSDLVPDYVGIRPKLAGPDGGFRDFVIRLDTADKDRGEGKMVSLLGIESPGLTSSLAIADMVVSNVLH